MKIARQWKSHIFTVGVLIKIYLKKIYSHFRIEMDTVLTSVMKAEFHKLIAYGCPDRGREFAKRKD